MLIVYLLAIFCSAALVFLAEPMAAKLVLPLLGGTPAVWTTCVLFFQMVLLAGYVYGYVLDRYLKPSMQFLVHAVVVGAACLWLPLGLSGAEAGAAGMVGGAGGHAEVELSLWLTRVLVGAVGAPFFVVSTTGPLLQRWFSRTGHAHARDPYFLYAASNAGSLLGLAAYPLAFEPLMGVRMQGWAWGIGYGIFAALAMLCGVMALRGGRDQARAGVERKGPVARRAGGSAPEGPGPVEGVAWKRRMRWLVLAAVPSSLMLGVTQQVATDVASVPLLWVIPLGLYLLTFILAFSPRVRVAPRTLGYALVALAPALVTTLVLGMRGHLLVLTAAHFGTFFVAALMCHRMLADNRPAPERLTEFYLMLAVGGAVGGLFNTLVAPVCFDNVYEYPIALAAALLLRPSGGPGVRGGSAVRAAVLPLLMLVMLLAMAIFFEHWDWHEKIGIATVWGLEPCARTVIPLGMMALALRRPAQLAACFAVYAGSFYFMSPISLSRLVYQERSFFGVLRVTEQMGGAWRTLSHGTTNHGMQVFTSEDLRRMPVSYYYPTGPIGQLFSALGGDPRTTDVAVIGLGTGSLAAYAREGERYTFYEIDSAVVRIARGTGMPSPLFTFLHDARGMVDVVIADGRQGLLKHAEDGQYGLLFVDAFSSDAIPVHLLTREAFEVYLRKLRPDGLLVVHISNRHFELSPIVARIAGELGCVCVLNLDPPPTDAESRNAKQQSTWMIVARTEQALAPLVSVPGSRWTAVEAGRRAPLWTDDFSNVLGALKRE